MGKGLVIAAVAIVGLGVWRWQDDGPPPPIAWDARMVKALTADLVDARGQPAPAQVLSGAKRILLYSSASWCPYCQTFTPELVAFYRDHGGGKTFQLLFISHDEDAGEMRAYMRDYDMPWWGVRYRSESAKLLSTAYPGHGIPRLVLLDGHGRILANGYENGRFIGWPAVMAAAAGGQ